MDDDRILRERRLAAALRANLKRRKQQARDRAAAERDSPGEAEETGSDAPGADRPPRRP